MAPPEQVVVPWLQVPQEAPPPETYAAGTWGPESADDLFHGCEGGWSQGRD